MRDIKPIKTEADHIAAMTRIDKLWDCKPGTPEDDELGVLVVLVDDYENKKYPIEATDPIEFLKFMMDQHGLKPVDFVDVFGGRGHVSEVLNRKRPMSLEQIRKLSEKLKIPIEILTQRYELETAA